MKQRIITGFLFTIGVLLFVVPSYFFPIVMILFSVLIGAVSIDEMIKALRAGEMSPSTPLIVVGAIASLLIAIISALYSVSLTTALTIYSLFILIYCFACLVLPSVFSTDGNHLKDGLISAAVVLYVSFPLFCLSAISTLDVNGWYYMIPALFAAWVSDVCAYFFGVTLGKHKIVPHISPKKTWEGCIGGAFGCAVIITVYFDLIIYQIADVKMSIVLFSVLSFVLGFVMSVMSQLGDWTASLIKRRVGIKDYGNIFPGHGGMLDRFDSTFFTIPIGVFLALISVLFT